MECKYDKKNNKDEDFILETKYWIVLLSYEQSYLGRSVIILKRHCRELSELKAKEWTDFSELVKKIELNYKKAFNVTMFNWTCLMNNSYKDKNPNSHVHWHVKPRYNHQVELSGIIFKDNEFGDKNKDKEEKVSSEIRKIIINKIKENF